MTVRSSAIGAMPLPSHSLILPCRSAMNFSGRVTNTSLSERSLNSTPAHVTAEPLSPLPTESLKPIAAIVYRTKLRMTFLRARVPCSAHNESSR